MSHLGRLRVALGLVLVVLVFAGAPPGVGAQTTSASVTGSVQDSQSGMLPGATVTLTSRTQGNVLTVRGEKRAARDDLKVRMNEGPAGPFRRVIALPPGVKVSEPNAQLRDGVLEIRFPRESREAAAPRPIPVT